MRTLQQTGHVLVAAVYGCLLAGLPLLVVVQSEGKGGVGAFSGVFAVSALVISLLAVGLVVLVGWIFTTFFGTARQMRHDIEGTAERAEAIHRLNKRLISGEITEFEYRRQVSRLGRPGR
jgi:uncharacterized membrane protein